MALIKCPECGKEISDKSDKCIYCGYPLKKYTIINNKEYDLSGELNLVLNGNIIGAIKSVREKTGLGLADGKYIVDYMNNQKECPSILNFEQKKETNVPHCPTCGSTNIKPITGTERAASIIGLGIFSKKINKTYKCLNCKSTW